MPKILEILPAESEPEDPKAGSLPPAETVDEQPAMRYLARRVIELVEDEGLTEKQAASQVSPMSWDALMNREDFTAAITEIRKRYGDVSDEEQKELIKAGWTKQMMEGLLSNDPVTKKLGQDASKLLAPHVGLAPQPAVQVGVQIGGDLAPLLKDADISSVIREEEE